MKMWRSKLRLAACLSLGFGLICVTRGESRSRAQTEPDSQQQFQQLIHSVEGPDLFRAYCASCHGSDGKGHGPALRQQL